LYRERQIEYSLIERTPERELLPMARELDLAITPWAALGGGLLTGKYAKDTKEPKRMKEGESKRLTPRNNKIVEEVIKVAEEIEQSPARVAINWVRQQPGLMIPIIGARTTKHIKDNLGCLEFELSNEHLKRLDDASQVELGFPHDFLTSDIIRNIVYGGTYDKIDNHRRR